MLCMYFGSCQKPVILHLAETYGTDKALMLSVNSRGKNPDQ